MVRLLWRRDNNIMKETVSNGCLLSRPPDEQDRPPSMIKRYHDRIKSQELSRDTFEIRRMISNMLAVNADGAVRRCCRRTSHFL
mmetsp:Transcript_20998/g.37936  ORF Transcript_20998/g.37936 Transcript_20998/m.37936 type:complete len:84 (+) Transcript_20998:1083-1334(+)